MMPVHSIPGHARLGRIVIEYPQTAEQHLALHFEHDGSTEILTVYSPDSLADIFELHEVLLGDIDVLDAGPDQREGFRQKLLFATDKGEFEIWATRIHVDAREAQTRR